MMENPKGLFEVLLVKTHCSINLAVLVKLLSGYSHRKDATYLKSDFHDGFHPHFEGEWKHIFAKKTAF